jgi:hypothetical protein
MIEKQVKDSKEEQSDSGHPHEIPGKAFQAASSYRASAVS